MGMEEDVAEEIDAARPDGKNLIVILDLELQLAAQVFPEVGQKSVERRLVRRQDHQIVGVSEVIPDALDLFQPMVESGQEEIREVLAQVVADR